MKQWLRHALCMLLTLAVAQSVAQNEVYRVFGQLKDQDTKKKLDGCSVQVFKDGTLYDTFEAGTSGKYEFELPLGFTYDLKFTKAEYSTKIIRIDTRNIPAEDRVGGFESEIEGQLFKIPDGFNTDLLKDPMAKASFDSQMNAMQFDAEYSDRRMEVIDKELQRLEDMAKNLNKVQAKFDELVQQGDQKMIEKKYQDAVNKFTEALNLIKDKEPAKSKLAEAQKKLDEENASKDAEAKYQKAVADGDAAFKKKAWAEAKKQYTDASKMKPAEEYPKEKLALIAEQEKDGEKRAEYDKLIADADNKFKNKDYAVSIEIYEQASDMYPNEAHPKDQIQKAKRALDDLLADEASKQKREAEYKQKIDNGEKAFAEDKLEIALKAYKDASGIKPDEQLPKTKITEIEKLIADRNKKTGTDAIVAADGEKERLEKEFNDRVKKADDLFAANKLLEAKTEYEGALTIKPDAQYPKQRIQRIELLLEDDLAAQEKARRKAEEDSLRKARATSLNGAAQDKAALLQKQKEDHERRWTEQQDQRITEQQEIVETKRNRSWESNADVEAEKAVEEFYRDAFAKQQYARIDSVYLKDKANRETQQTNAKEQNKRIAESMTEQADKAKENATIAANGESWAKRHASDSEEKKKQDAENNKQYLQKSEMKHEKTIAELDQKQEQKNSLTQNDRYRQDKVEDMKDKMELVDENNKKYQENATERIEINYTKVEEKNMQLQEMNTAGEETRKANEEKLQEKVKTYQSQHQDLSNASDERIMTTQAQLNKKHELKQSIGEGNTHAQDNAQRIEDLKEKRELEALQKDIDAANRHSESLNTVKAKLNGGEKDVDAYPVKPGTEDLPEGVTENSYELGNKKVTERTVKIGNKVDVYKKIVSKTGIYYFKNERSITETIWKQETLREGR